MANYWEPRGSYPTKRSGTDLRKTVLVHVYLAEGRTTMAELHYDEQDGGNPLYWIEQAPGMDPAVLQLDDVQLWQKGYNGG